MSPDDGALPHGAPGSPTAGGPAASGGAFSRYRSGIFAAARQAVADHAAIAFAAAFGVLRDAELAERIAAEVLIDGLEGPGAPPEGMLGERAWVVAAARARALAALGANARGRSRGRRSTAPPRAGEPPEARLGEMVDPAAALTAFAALPEAARDALSLAYGSGLPPDEVGQRIAFTTDETRDILREGLSEVAERLARGADE
jgi:DNA-directed RNA polymerase specialized sigma24 family protein